jgi:acyl carrier protein
MALSRESLLDALRNELGVDTAPLNDDSPLFSSGLIDSFSLVTLIVFIEKEAQIKVQPLDVNLENLDTVARILNFANRAR